MVVTILVYKIIIFLWFQSSRARTFLFLYLVWQLAPNMVSSKTILNVENQTFPTAALSAWISWFEEKSWWETFQHTITVHVYSVWYLQTNILIQPNSRKLKNNLVCVTTWHWLVEIECKILETEAWCCCEWLSISC